MTESVQDKGQPDRLLYALSYLSRRFGRTRSIEALVAGLPYDKRGMGPDLFCTAASRIGLKTRILERPLDDIDDAVLPCVLILGAKDACVLISRDTVTAEALLYVAGKGEVRVPLADLSKIYKNYAILVYPEPEATTDPMTGAVLDAPDKHWFWGVVRQNRALYRRVGLAAFLINLFALASPLFVMNVYDRVIPNSALHTGWVLATGMMIVYIFDFIMRMLRAYFTDLAGRKIDVLAAKAIYDQILNMRLSTRPKSSGAFASMLRDFESVKEFFTSATLAAFVDLPFVLIFVGVIYFVSPELGLIVVGVTITAAFVAYILQRPLRFLTQKLVESAEARHGVLVETIQGLETIKAIRADGRFRAKYGDHVGESAILGQTNRFFSNLTLNVAVFLQQISSVLVIVAGMYLVTSGKLTLGALIASVMLSGRATAPIAQIAGIISRYHSSRGALQTLNKIMAQPSERPANARFLHRPHFEGAIRFDRVRFAYPHAGREALSEASFNIKAGEKVGVIGRIGSGKSTIARLIMGLYEPASGTILLDDTDHRQIDPADLRRNIAYIPQDVILFSGTIRDNITIANPHATDADVLEACRAAGVDDFVSRMPQGYDTAVGERGEGLSGGQRQSVALARALINSPRILVCDEPTNSMDMQAEELFARHIEAQARTRTLVLITHRSTLMRLVERLIVIDQGRVIADGPRDDVLAALASGSVKVKAGG